MKKSLLVCLVVLLCAAAAQAAGGLQPLHVKTGLWQSTVNNQLAGGIPPDMQARLAAMPPEQRARIEAMMQKQFSGTPQGSTFKSCLTQKDLNDSAPWGSGTKCTWTVLTSTSTDLEVKGTDCDAGKKEGMNSEFHVKIHVVDSGHVKATFDGTMTGNGHTTTMNGNYTSEWVGPTCPADAK
ncbi:MAG TPA: DUF3617 domain-containing protein [Terracidiphilus sp.]|nr:DUF3617 domain-containing protein [Terracidiphilus sp.]